MSVAGGKEGRGGASGAMDDIAVHHQMQHYLSACGSIYRYSCQYGWFSHWMSLP